MIFFGTSEFAAGILETLVNHNYLPSLVVTQPDKAVGRKQLMAETPVAQVAQRLFIKTIKPNDLSDPTVLSELKLHKSKIFVVVAYGKIIPQHILDIPTKGAINIHGSLLPKYRGASPIHQAILDGEDKTGITIMLMDGKMDHGPILMQKEVTILPDDNFVTLELKLSQVAQELILETIKEALEIGLKPKEQDHNQATFTKIIKKTDGLIDWNTDAKKIYDKFRAYIVWPGIHTIWKGMNLKINLCKSVKSSHTEVPAGTVIREGDKVLITCGDGALELITVQLEGKKALPVEEFIRGHHDFLGSILGK